MPSTKYSLPAFLQDRCSDEVYQRWLGRKAKTHVKRDRARQNWTATPEEYKIAIHKAVVNSGGLDQYTGESLDWNLISTYDNEKSKQERRAYKRKFANLPTVDHVGDGTGPADFVICGWRTNDCKNDLSLAEFIEFCRAVLAHCDQTLLPRDFRL